MIYLCKVGEQLIQDPHCFDEVESLTPTARIVNLHALKMTQVYLNILEWYYHLHNN